MALDVSNKLPKSGTNSWLGLDVGSNHVFLCMVPCRHPTGFLPLTSLPGSWLLKGEYCNLQEQHCISRTTGIWLCFSSMIVLYEIVPASHPKPLKLLSLTVHFLCEHREGFLVRLLCPSFYDAVAFIPMIVVGSVSRIYPVNLTARKQGGATIARGEREANVYFRLHTCREPCTCTCGGGWCYSQCVR
jgi:hypothetical protein